ncbi:flagellar basal body rod C-terminal domain-containing protein [Bdellovibrionota bacterium FG-2]
MHSNNIANSETTRTPKGGPFQRQELGNCYGWNCEVVSIPAFTQRYNPAHPDADEMGYVEFPDIDLIEEMVAIIDAQRNYEGLIAENREAAAACKRPPE